MSDPRDSDDFLGWAPDLGFWDVAPPVPATSKAQPAPPVPPPPPPGPVRAAPPTKARPPASQTPARARPGRQPSPKAVRAIPVVFAVVLVVTMWTALMTALGSRSSPVMLVVFVAVTALQGTISWIRGRR